MASRGAQKFQAKLSSKWTNYSGQEDKILKHAYLAGFPNAKYALRGQRYEVHFGSGMHGMQQKNIGTGRTREIRPPRGMKRPSVPIVPAGPTMCITIRPGQPGTSIQLPHPRSKDSFFWLSVPAAARVGQSMLVPVPPPEACTSVSLASAPPADAKISGGGWATGGKVAGVAVAGAGAVVGGIVLAEALSDDVDVGVTDGIMDAAETVGEWAGDAAEDVADWADGAAEDVGDFVMDLF